MLNKIYIYVNNFTSSVLYSESARVSRVIAHPVAICKRDI